MQTRVIARSATFTLSIALAVITLLVSPSLFAQNTGQLVLEEIIVTAQKRQETLQDVPISVAVINAQGLNDAGLDKIEDVQH